MKPFLSILRICFFFACSVLLAGVIYQFTISKNEDQKFPSPGKLIDIGGYSLHINCSGEGSPTVILEAGMGSNSLDWSLVQPEAAKFTRVCSYDRAGNGWSDRSPKPRLSSIIVEELHTLLQNAGIHSPYILVGHSFGGINVRLYERKFSDEVAGIVLVDSSHEQQFERMNFSTKIPVWEKSLFVHLKAYSGWSRIRNQMGKFHESWSPFNEETKMAYFAKVNTTKSILTLAEESESFLQSLKQMRAADATIDNKPLIVITAGKYDFGGPSVMTDEIKEQQRIWNELQLDLVSKSSVGKQVIARDSGHGIPAYQPEVIVSAIKEVFDLLVQKSKK